MKKAFLLLSFTFFIASISLVAQKPVWKLAPGSKNLVPTEQMSPSWRSIKAYQQFEINFNTLRSFILTQAPAENQLGKTISISLPMPDGNVREFYIMESPVMEPELALKYPEIKTYKGSDGMNYMRLFMTNSELKAYILTDQGDVVIEPLVKGNADNYGVYWAKNIEVDPSGLSLACGEGGRVVFTDQNKTKEDHGHTLAASVLSAQPVILHTYRLALACTGEWGMASGLGGGSVQTALAKMADALTYANAVYEKDFAIHINLCANNDKIVFLNPNNDPYDNNGSGGSLLDQNPGVVNPIITPGFYEYGHVFNIACTDVGGIASLGSVCATSGKARGVTCWYTTDVAYVAQRIFCHEMGHQFSASHTFSNCNGNESGTRYEPGGGTTIMSYSGLCGNLNIESSNLPHPNFFHTNSLEQVIGFTRGMTCGVKKDAGNTYPSATILTKQGLYLPIQTPFELKGSGSDLEDTTLTFGWEQFDNGAYGDLLGDVSENGPLFRVLFPGSSPNRTIPQWNSIINLDNVDVREFLPKNTRDLKFRFVVRDNHPGAGGSTYELLKLKVSENAGPFAVKFPNATSDRLVKNTCNTIKWNVNKTNEAPVNCQKVDILMFKGREYNNPILLKANTDNDGSELVDIPDIGNNIRVRIWIRAADHIFFDISDADILIIESTTPKVSMGVSPNVATLCLPDILNVTVRSCAFGGFSGNVNLFVESGLPAGSTYQFSKPILGPNEESNLSLDLRNLTGKASLKLVIAAITPAGDTLRDELNVNAIKNDFSDGSLLSPFRSERGLTETPLFRWKKSDNADSYHFELATSPAFGNTILYSEQFVFVDSLRLPILLKENTIYYWRLIPVNLCGEGGSSEIFVFQTKNKSCIDQPFTGNPIGLFPSRTNTTAIPIAFSGRLSDMNVNGLQIQADAVRDVNINLISPAGTKVNLFNYNCAVTLDFDCSFDDEAPIGLTCPPTRGTRMRPFEPLGKLIGEDLKGDWKLEIVTKNTFRTGQLENFTLQYCADLTVEAPALVNNGPLKLQVGETKSVDNQLLLCTDKDNVPNDLVYTLVYIPNFGELKLNGNVLVYGSTFTQKDVDDNRLSYTHNGSTNYYDGFSYTLNDGRGGWLGIENFQILVGPVATDNPKNDVLISAFPNPTKGMLVVNIEAQGNTSGAVLSFKNLNGKTLLERKLFGEKNMNLDLHQYSDGVYFLEYKSGISKTTKKIILTR
ncbi:MAG: proprotein convertase P-domain-containing protein [Saprospiraceae bacterium]|nr:proprotein convertase P-domain-containing protein [Saprospiraceae bacterium]